MSGSKKRESGFLVGHILRYVQMYAPKFKQCIVFTTYDRSTKGFYPAAFVLCTSRRYEMYFHAIRLILDATDYAMDPEFTYCDLEAGLIRAIREHFPDTSPIACLFHFKQACWRKMKKYRILEKECNIAMKQGVLDMLTVIPQEKVKKKVMAWVKSKIEDKCELAGIKYSEIKWGHYWKYFNRTWIIIFPPNLWNVAPFTRDLLSRTNNPVERFNHEMNGFY
ncbi:hypothetical protein PHMEG_0009751 [Phytophthora megakarya]|uniref:MULE transposase domain-containing protein n=1 Tax=Phytophthora megakarya TaxID=4795 RepID=A0A225WFF0_9STRA|nr:hypothetical protein PHMEG_0009751 [Phytophthora megakarya]